MSEKRNGKDSSLEHLFSSQPTENPVLTIDYQDSFGKYQIELSGAGSDHFAVFEHTGRIIVLTTNTRYKYALLKVFERRQQVKEFSIEGKADIRQYLGKRGLRLSDLEIARRLYQHV